MASSEQKNIDTPTYFFSNYPCEETWIEKKGPNSTTYHQTFSYPTNVLAKEEDKHMRVIINENAKRILVYRFRLDDPSVFPFNETTKEQEIDMKSCGDAVKEALASHPEVKISMNAKAIAWHENTLFVVTSSHVSIYDLKQKGFVAHHRLAISSKEVQDAMLMNDRLFVVEENCISVFGVSGTGIEYQSSFGADQLKAPKGIAFHAESKRMLIVDRLENGKKSRIASFDMNHNFVGYFVNEQEGCMEGISISGKFVCVTDSKLGRINVYLYDESMKESSTPICSELAERPKGIFSIIPADQGNELMQKCLYLFVSCSSRMLMFRMYRTIENIVKLIHQLQMTTPFSFSSAPKFVPVEEMAYICETKDEKLTKDSFLITPMPNRAFACLSKSGATLFRLTESNEIMPGKSITFPSLDEISAFKFYQNKFYIADRKTDTVNEYSEDGTKLHEYRIPRSKPGHKGQLKDFYCYSDCIMLLDEWGKSNHGLGYLHLFSLKTQKCLKSYDNFEYKKQLSCPTAVAVDEKRNRILVADGSGIPVSIKIFSLENGKFITSFGLNDLKSASHIIVDEKYKILESFGKMMFEYDPDSLAFVQRRMETTSQWSHACFQDGLMAVISSNKVQIFQVPQTKSDTPRALNWELPYGFPVYEFGSPFPNKFNQLKSEFQSPRVHISSGILYMTDANKLTTTRNFQLFHNAQSGFEIRGILHHTGLKPIRQFCCYKDVAIVSYEDTDGFHLLSWDNFSALKVIKRGRSHEFYPHYFVVHKGIIYSIGDDVEKTFFGSSSGVSVSVFSLEKEEYLSSWDLKNERYISRCGGMAVSEEKEWILFSDDDIKGIIKVFDLNGKFVKAFGQNVLNRPRGIATRGDDCFVVDEKLNAVYVFSLTTGNLKLKFGHLGHGFGEFLHPTTIQLLNGVIVVGDEWNHRVQMFI